MFDDEGHIDLTPRQLLQQARENPARLINDFLVRSTPRAFTTYRAYCDFLHDVSTRIGVHPMNLFVRGSCHLGYSISPRTDKLWAPYHDRSDIDLAIVDVDYFTRIDRELQEWESQNRELCLQYAWQHASRVRNRGFRCCRDHDFPLNLCVPHTDCMTGIAVANYCGFQRDLSAFIFRDWWALRKRYEYDLRAIVVGIEAGTLSEPPDH